MSDNGYDDVDYDYAGDCWRDEYPRGAPYYLAKGDFLKAMVGSAVAALLVFIIIMAVFGT